MKHQGLIEKHAAALGPGLVVVREMAATGE